MDTPLRRFCRRIRRRRGPFDRFIGGARRPHAVFGPLRHPFSRLSTILDVLDRPGRASGRSQRALYTPQAVFGPPLFTRLLGVEDPLFTRLLGDRWVAVCDHSGFWGAWDPLCTIGGGVGRSADPPQAPLFSIIRGLGDSGAPWTPSVRSSAILGVPDRRGSLFFDHWGFWVIMIVADRFFSIIGDSGRFCPIPDDSGVVWTHLDTFRYPFFSIFGDSGRFWSFFIGPDTLLRDHRGDWATTGRVGPGPLFTRLLRGRSEGWRGPPSARSALGERHSRQAESSLGLSG